MLRAVANIPLYVGSFTYATLPAAASNSGMEAFASDWGANGTKVRSNGTRWLPMGGQVALKHLGAASSPIANTATIVLQTQIPVGALQATDQIMVYGDGFTKSGTTDTAGVNIYCGTAGTTSDTALVNTFNVFLLAASRTGGFAIGFKVISNTSIQRIGANTGNGLYGANSANAASAPVTVSDASANALWVSVAILSAGATDTLIAQELRIVHVAG